MTGLFQHGSTYLIGNESWTVVGYRQGPEGWEVTFDTGAGLDSIPCRQLEAIIRESERRAKCA